MSDVPPAILRLARQATRVTVLTGAGMSQESGVPTFRDAHTGLWARFDPLELATPQAWARDRDLVWAWYLHRVRAVRAAQPNAGHLAIADWSRRPGVSMQLVTQNVDDLHERAGSTVLAHLHGSLVALRCDTCGRAYPGSSIAIPVEIPQRLAPPPCPTASAPAVAAEGTSGCPGHVRPGVVWFDEPLPTGLFDAAVDAVRSADLALVVGTSGVVYPAAMLPDLAETAGVPVVEINSAVTGLNPRGRHSWRSTAAVALPALLAALD
ncbi:MAG TPA: NAD-dependent protein deacylase [Dermatophilaceae bacterium]|nr:NAD-dependent protein deacylase [Dermatophilaceae bacterium]